VVGYVHLPSGMTNREQWRQLYLTALDHSGLSVPQPLIDQARAAIFDRLLDLCDLSDSNQAEEEDLREALRELWKAENRHS
jgi:RIO-like serine/threonine protein kinase